MLNGGFPRNNQSEPDDIAVLERFSDDFFCCGMLAHDLVPNTTLVVGLLRLITKITVAAQYRDLTGVSHAAALRRCE